MTNEVVNFVYREGKPFIVQNNEIDAIMNFLNHYENIQVQKINLNADQRVKITASKKTDHEGAII